MKKLKKIVTIIGILLTSQVIFLSFAQTHLVINGTGENSKVIPMKGKCQKIINNCGYPIFVPLYPSGATKSFFQNIPSCVTLTDCVHIVKCGGTLPANAMWNSSDNYSQTLVGVKWKPIKSANFNIMPSTDDCRFMCNENYIWTGGSCKPATKVVNCIGKINNSVYNGVSSITQEWNGSAWMPSNVATYNATSSTTECRYTCDTNYHWNGTACLPDTRVMNCTAKPVNSIYNSVSSISQTWNGSAWIPSNVTTYNTTASSTECRYTNAPGYRWDTTTQTFINTCVLPWGGTITHGQGVTAYNKTSGTCPTNNCASQLRTCNGENGVLDGFSTYQYASCTPNGNTQPCSITNGAGSQSCTAGSTSRGACTVTSCSAGYRILGNSCINTCTLPWGGGTKTNGETITAYDKTSGTCPSNNCASQTRTCNGSLGTFDGSYQYASCTPNGNTQPCSIANGAGSQSCTANSTSRGSCTVTSCNAGYRISGNSCINTCTLPWGGITTPDKPVIAYDKASGTCPTNNCVSQLRTCNGENGVLNGSYTYASCTPNGNTQPCSITNGVGSQSCTAGSTSRGACAIVGCNPGCTNVGGTCVCSITRIGYCSGHADARMDLERTLLSYTQTSYDGGSNRTPIYEYRYYGPINGSEGVPCLFGCTQGNQWFPNFVNSGGWLYQEYNTTATGSCDCEQGYFWDGTGCAREPGQDDGGGEPCRSGEQGCDQEDPRDDDCMGPDCW